jgi:hypothetical protein
MDMDLIEICRKPIKFFFITLFFRQNNYHKYGVLLHTLKVLYGVLKAKDYRFITVALLHDIGKPFVAYQKPSDKLNKIYSFTAHEEKSYNIIKNIPFISSWTKDIVRYHFLIIDMKRKKENNEVEGYLKLEKIWNSLSGDFKQDLEIFLKYDNFGKI